MTRVVKEFCTLQSRFRYVMYLQVKACTVPLVQWTMTKPDFSLAMVTLFMYVLINIFLQLISARSCMVGL